MHTLKYVMYIDYIHLLAGMEETADYPPISTLSFFPLVVRCPSFTLIHGCSDKESISMLPFQVMSYLTNFWPIG